jgi:hypothetical protein
MINHLRQRLQALQKAPGIEGRPGALTFGIPAIDTMLGGGFARGALHELARRIFQQRPGLLWQWRGVLLYRLVCSGSRRIWRWPKAACRTAPASMHLASLRSSW